MAEERAKKRSASAKSAGKRLAGAATDAPVEKPEPAPIAEIAQERPNPPRHEERLQKIIAAAGLASRRKAEELILEGRVQINGKIVTELGTKADAARDHIRVDGKLLHGAQRLRYAVLNKPKGFVTTASDPEGRPTVMQFFEGGTRVFPVGRLDYLSEGLLIMTNDGELANLLTKASSKVEKVYLVKVSGKPSDQGLNQLRAGVMIEKGRRDRREGRILTQPAAIRLVRDAENPWYEMTLTEGRNREIRKMFEEIGHHVEKIRRVGYGPLVLDVEPGEVRELTAEEVLALQRAARGIRTATKTAAARIKPSGLKKSRQGLSNAGAVRSRPAAVSSPLGQAPKRRAPAKPRRSN